jgi:hypothetical protein
MDRKEARMTNDRRQFLRGGTLALGAVTAGTVTAGSVIAAKSTTSATESLGRRCAGFGWELSINNDFAALYFPVQQEMTLVAADIDLAYTITAAPATAGFAECLFRAGVTRGAPPNLDPRVYAFPQSSDFGDVLVSHPENFYGYEHILLQDVFYHVILKTWVPRDGTASATSRFTHVEPQLQLSQGDFLVFQGGGDGILGGDAEMQVVLGYALPSTRVVAFR